MAEIRKTLPELTAELEEINVKIDEMINEIDTEGITEEPIEENGDDPDEEERADELIERKKEIEGEIAELEKRNKMAEDVKKSVDVIESHEERNKTMDVKEIRKSAEYKDAFGEYLKKGLEGINGEQRALLTENTENGTIAVPHGVQDKINTAWENDEIMQRITKTYFKGNLRVGYEDSASGAVKHTEGGAAVEPENLVINYVDLMPAMYKKVVEVSDEVLANNDTMVDYLYDEIQYQIVKLLASEIVTKIAVNDLTAQYTMAGTTPTTADIVGAAGLLGGEAADPVLITTRANAATIKAAALSASYGYDAFDGMPVVYTDASALGEKAFVIADLTGVQTNFPEGDDAKFKFDDLTKADADIVRIIGRLYAGIGVVAKGKTVAATPKE